MRFYIFSSSLVFIWNDKTDSRSQTIFFVEPQLANLCENVLSWPRCSCESFQPRCCRRPPAAGLCCRTGRIIQSDSRWEAASAEGGERSATWQHSGRRKETDCQLFVTPSLRWLIRATRTGVTVHGGHGAPCYVGFGVTAWYEFSTTWKRLQIIQKSIKFCFIYFQQTAGEVGLFHPVPLDIVGTVCSGLKQQGGVVGRGRNHGVTQDMIRLTIHYPP